MSTPSGHTADVPSLKAISAAQLVLSWNPTDDDLEKVAKSLTWTRFKRARTRQIIASSLPPSIKGKITVKECTGSDTDRVCQVVYLIQDREGQTPEEVTVAWDTRQQQDGRTGGPVICCTLSVTYKTKKGTFEASGYADWRGGEGWVEILSNGYRGVFMDIGQDLGLDSVFTPLEEPSAILLNVAELVKESQGGYWSDGSDSMNEEKLKQRCTEDEMLICMLRALVAGRLLDRELYKFGIVVPSLAAILADVDYRE